MNCEQREVGITRRDHGMIEHVLVQHSHNIDGEREVAGILFRRAGRRLHRDDVVLNHGLLPFLESRRPAIAAGNGKAAELAAAFYVNRGISGGRVLRVDEKRNKRFGHEVYHDL
jgi:hypothetical protein